MKIFEPHRQDDPDTGLATWMFEDTACQPRVAFPGLYKFIDELYAIDDGRLVGVRFWKPEGIPFGPTKKIVCGYCNGSGKRKDGLDCGACDGTGTPAVGRVQEPDVVSKVQYEIALAREVEMEISLRNEIAKLKRALTRALGPKTKPKRGRAK